MVDELSKQSKPGPVVLFGSGETSASGRKVFDRALRKLQQAPRLALLETPAGFELNSARVIGRVADFIGHRLQNYAPQLRVVPARKRGTDYSPDDPEVVAPLLESDLIFMGPGSPSYAVRQLKDSLAWYYLLARHRLGATLVLASAATIAISAFALPVYEIYKVGEDLHWKEGLDFFGPYGLPLVFIPHWNNQEGGEELDTSRCFMGRARFAALMEMLPADLTVVGIDEHTALIMDPQGGECHVVGAGGVTLIHTGPGHGDEAFDLHASGLDVVAEARAAHVHQYPNGETFPLSECCPFDALLSPQRDLPAEVWQRALAVQAQLEAGRKPPDEHPPEVQALVEQRQEARTSKDWAKADQLRQQIAELGWEVQDTPEGPKLVLSDRL